MNTNRLPTEVVDSQIKVSWFTRMLWWIAGAENSILITCETDYQRFACIGKTILMTTITAVLAGTWAAWYFGAEYYSILFGLFWGTLIFSIDRSLIVTLRKKPKEAGENKYKRTGRFVIAILFRAILALLIAFMISIPLELYLFQDSIVDQRDTTNKQKKEDNRAYLCNEYEIDKDSIKIAQTKEIRNQAEINANTPINDSEYNNIKGKIAEQNLELKKEQKKTVDKKANSLIKYYPQDHEDISLRGKFNKEDNASYYKYIKSDEYKDAQANCKTARNNVDSLTVKLEAREKAYKQEQDSIKEQKEKEIKDLEERRKENIITVKEKEERYKENIIKEGKRSFILDYVALKDAAKNDKTLWWMLWGIRMIFFIIELLPTIVKMATPMGCYDRHVYQKENELEEYLKYIKDNNKLQDNFERQITHRKEMQELKYKMEKECAEQQTKVAQEAILFVTKDYAEKWKNKCIKDK